MRHAAVYEEEEALSGNSAELSLGLGTLLGVFFGLALVCGVFFGFGYMIGHRPTGLYTSSEPLSIAPKQTATPTAPKPSALVAEQPAESSRVVLPVSTPGRIFSATRCKDPRSSADCAKRENACCANPTPRVVPTVAANTAFAIAQPRPTVQTASSTTTAIGGGFMVQIAAVKSRPDAEALADALRKDGFSPTVRTESQDKFLHVQLGPFANRDDAKAMRQKLSSAGYNALSNNALLLLDQFAFRRPHPLGKS